MLKAYFFIGLFFLFTQVFGQVDAVPKTNLDSNMVKQLFFAGLREKMNENYVVASNNFSKIVSLDPQSDAAYYELANANLRMDKLAEAEINIKQAIKLSGDNKWYWILLSEVQKRTNNMSDLIVTLNQLIRIEPEREAYYFDRANAQLISNQIEEAKKTYQEIENKFGESKQLLQAKLRIKDNTKVAESDLVKLLEGNQAGVKNYLYAAGLLLQKGNDAEALVILKKAQVIEPDNYEVNLSLADIYRMQKKDDLAFSALKLAFESAEMPLDEKVKIVISLFPNLTQPNLAMHIVSLSEILATKNATEAKVLALYGDVLYQQNKLKEALPQYLSALKLNEQIYAVWEQVINIQTLLGHYSEAVKTGDEALSIYPNQASLYYFMGYALFKTGKTDLALSNLKTALQLDTENKAFQSQVYALQGDIHINQNNFQTAKVAFEKSINLDPDNYFVMNNYAYYLALRDDDLSKAEKYAETAANAMPTSASITDTYAYVLFKLQKYVLAQKWIEKAIQNNTTKSGVYFERYGDILYMQGNKDAALSQWQKAKELGNGSNILNKKINEKKYIK